jgi:hypothetical protein
MATQIKRIEKDLLLKSLYDEQIPLIYLRDRTEYSLTLEKPSRADIYLKSNRIIPELRNKRKIHLIFNFRGQVISCSTEIISFRYERIVAKTPEFLYKNLDRSYSRVPGPKDAKIKLPESGRAKNEPLEGSIIDISASGILFACPLSMFSPALLPDSEAAVIIVTPARSVTSRVWIVRRYQDNALFCFGCRFLGMSPEDTRYLFEFIYGRPFTASDAAFLSGHV